MNTKEHEDKCYRCGKCCRIKVRLPNGSYTLSDYFCRYFDNGTRQCRVYKDRHTACQECQTVIESLGQRALPNSCGYVQGIKTYDTVVDHPIYKEEGYADVGRCTGRRN